VFGDSQNVLPVGHFSFSCFLLCSFEVPFIAVAIDDLLSFAMGILVLFLFTYQYNLVEMERE